MIIIICSIFVVYVYSPIKKDKVGYLIPEDPSKPCALVNYHDLKDMQKLVGGYIEIFDISKKKIGDHFFDAVVCNEEGKLMGKRVNVRATQYLSPLKELVGDLLFIHDQN